MKKLIPHKTLKIGICLLALGLIGIIFCGSQSKININKITAADWQSCQHINGIGQETISKLEANAPYERIEDAEKIVGIGTKKADIIKRHFCTYDTCRFEIFITVLIISAVLLVIGGLIIFCVLTRRKIFSEKLKEGLNLK